MRLSSTSYPRTWRNLSIWPLVSKSASACVSDAWLPLVLGAGGNPAFQGPPTTSIVPAWSWARTVGATSIVCPKETTKAGSGPLPLLWEAGPLCSIVSFKSQGPLVNRGVLVGVSPLISPQSRTQFSATITYQDSIHSCKALIDSGAEASSLECSTAKSWGIPAIPLSSPVTVWGLSGQPVATITHTTPCVILVVSGNHSESVVLFRMKSSNASLVLGHPWLV